MRDYCYLITQFPAESEYDRCFLYKCRKFMASGIPLVSWRHVKENRRDSQTGSRCSIRQACSSRRYATKNPVASAAIGLITDQLSDSSLPA